MIASSEKHVKKKSALRKVSANTTATSSVSMVDMEKVFAKKTDVAEVKDMMSKFGNETAKVRKDVPIFKFKVLIFIYLGKFEIDENVMLKLQ